MNIHSIYPATEGEGIHIGTPQVFVRFQGCQVGCRNCDSKETWSFAKSRQLVLNEVLHMVASFSLSRVSITGGDPLHPKNQDDCLSLSCELKSKGYFVHLEAAGQSIHTDIFDTVDFISLDCKTPSTGVKQSQEILETFMKSYAFKGQIKSVIENFKDLDYVYDMAQSLVGPHKKQLPISWCLTPAYTPGRNFSLDFFHSLITENQRRGGFFRVIGQQHKWIHGSDKLEV